MGVNRCNARSSPLRQAFSNCVTSLGDGFTALSQTGSPAADGAQGLRQRGQIAVRVLPAGEKLLIQLPGSGGVALERRPARQSEFGQRVQSRHRILPLMIEDF